MLGLALAGVVAAAIALIWYKIVVPFDDMRELSEELDDPGYKIAFDRAPEQPPEVWSVAFSSDLQKLHEALLVPQPFPSSPPAVSITPHMERSLMKNPARHTCTPECPCRIDLATAVAALNVSSKILQDSILYGSDELIEGRFVALRVAWVKVIGAHAAYRDHFADA
jgi:hypothetical protein